MNVKIDQSWKDRLAGEFSQSYFSQLTDFVRKEYQTSKIYPPGNLIFNAFDKCPYDQLKVVILGQDPYHGFGQAHGLCFSVRDGIKYPPSLLNIFKEIKQDVGKEIPATGNLERWASQGVLLLNTTLTVREGSPASHQGKGWEQFTDAVISTISAEKEGIVFLLWGSHARKKSELIDQTRHFVLSAPHPSPLSANRGFFGCRHFSKTNDILERLGRKPIEW